MGVTIEVIVPWRGGCPDRERAFAWLLGRWTRAGWRVTVAEDPRTTDAPWVKADAVMPAAHGSTADVIVVADADVWCDDVVQAVDAVVEGAGWAVPHRMVRRLDNESTAAVLDGAPWPAYGLTERPYRGHAGGGIVVLTRSTLLDCPLDRRFVGWGHEDDAWADALSTTAGKPWRGAGPLWHLWHPPQPRLSRTTGSRAGVALQRRYRAAAGDRAAMAALLDEGRSAAWRSQRSASR